MEIDEEYLHKMRGIHSHYSEKINMKKFTEELLELSVVLQKYEDDAILSASLSKEERTKEQEVIYQNLLTELADVFIVFRGFMMRISPDTKEDIQKMVEFKIDRQISRISEKDKKGLL